RDWSSDVCSSDLTTGRAVLAAAGSGRGAGPLRRAGRGRQWAVARHVGQRPQGCGIAAARPPKPVHPNQVVAAACVVALAAAPAPVSATAPLNTIPEPGVLHAAPVSRDRPRT